MRPDHGCVKDYSPLSKRGLGGCSPWHEKHAYVAEDQKPEHNDSEPVRVVTANFFHLITHYSYRSESTGLEKVIFVTAELTLSRATNNKNRLAQTNGMIPKGA